MHDKFNGLFKYTHILMINHQSYFINVVLAVYKLDLVLFVNYM